jgi:bacillithiol system protein YtxJ
VLGDVLKRLKRTKTGSGSVGFAILGPDADLGEIMTEDLCVLFKHSNACPVSWAAHAQVSRFVRENPGTSVYMIPVIKERALSDKITAAIGLEHESPQVIVLREGVVAASASHGDITVESISEMLDAYPAK